MRTRILLFSLVLAATAVGQQTDDLIIPITTASHILVPAAGDVAGANGTHFRSDITVLNLRDATQRVAFRWLPQGVDGSAIAPRFIELSPATGFTSENFVANILQQSGLGSIEIVGVTDGGAPDASARLHVTSRIWTPRPDGEAGTMSQTFPAIVLDADESPLKAVFGMKRSSQYRLNVGISNPSNRARTYNVLVSIFGEGTPQMIQFTMSVPASSMQLRTVTEATSEGTAQILIEDVTSGNPVGSWHAWVSSIDNESGDAWSQMAIDRLQ